MSESYTHDPVHLAAKLYYVDNLPQTDIAKFINVSQAKISRLLAEARQRGIVQITVAEYEFRNRDLEKALQDRFGLLSAYVIRSSSNIAPEDFRRMVAHFAAPLVASLLQPGMTVAVSGGRTLKEIVQSLPEVRCKDITVVQTMGSIDSHIGPVDALEVARTIARHCGGSFITLNTPAFLPDKKTRESFTALSQIDSVRQRMSKADLALIGVGTLSNSVFVERGMLPEKEVHTLQDLGAVGEICGRFFDIHGQECQSLWRDRVVSIEFEQLRRIPQVVAAVVGSDRALAIAAAIKGNLLKSLIIDDVGAKTLLELPENIQASNNKANNSGITTRAIKNNYVKKKGQSAT
ncbi:sugar-binding transcriptional regulator [Pedosphaera parvula]|uniref:Transcriptional regulator, DeoR family n=1 Tax=Pedosphaera parvula (strain Ellin514) TaxID=320771 RepID=B9XEH9_PEDPL|nr:sugar-binding transcriptional regulator [Pedosphaera parvula]EEF61693.1 transcriptional regulator, DeoR family [Pedosphaera parvula Ellin514]